MFWFQQKRPQTTLLLFDGYIILTLKQELSGTKAYKDTSEEKSVVNGHCNHLALKFPTMYWLPKLHKKTYKARFIANSSSCTITELYKLLASFLTAVKNHKILCESL